MTLLSVQLYTLRQIPLEERMLDIVADAGFQYVELYGALFSQATRVQSLLEQRNLKSSGTHVSLEDLKGDLARVVDQANIYGITSLFVPSVPVPLRDMGASGWREFGRDLASVADELAKSDLTIGYHTHDWDFRPKEGDQTALDLVFDAAGSAPVEWEADIAWLSRAGVDPLVWLERYQSRLTAVHIKDLSPIGTNEDEDGWADVGSGILDWSVLWPSAIERGAKVMVIEHDRPLDPARTITRGFQFVSERFL